MNLAKSSSKNKKQINEKYPEYFQNNPEEFVNGLKTRKYKEEQMDRSLKKSVKKYKKLSSKVNRKKSLKYLGIFLKPYLKYL